MKAFNAFLRGAVQRARGYGKPLKKTLITFSQKVAREVYNNLVRSVATIIVTIVLFYGGYNVFEGWKQRTKAEQIEQQTLRKVRLPGCVVATGSLMPIDSVRVSVRDFDQFEAYTNETGEFVLEIELSEEVETVDLLFQRAGYEDEFYPFVALPAKGSGLHKVYQLVPRSRVLVANTLFFVP